jgi:phosphate ABC transporter phosphate-binding protein
MRLALLVAITAAVVAVEGRSFPSAEAASSHSLIQGSGSSWSANAVDQWIADVKNNGLQVVFTANGSAQGRKDFGYRTNDFAVSDIGYLGRDPLTGELDDSQGRAFAYLPIVAGGTSFPYQIRDHGQLVRDLRLSGQTLAKIFTNRITNWSDPAITADNHGRVLPSLSIVPVVHSEGSGATAQFTAYVAQQYPDLWRSFAGQDVSTEYYPRKDPAIGQNGADGVMNFVSSQGANGSIGYDEYSYALAKNYPVAKIQNTAGYFTLPNQYNVAVALTQAAINRDKSSPNYLLQDLKGVYAYNDKRTYPLSSYSYGIIPTAADDSKLSTTAAKQTLADFLYYSICDGQKEMGPIGYSPLPINLVQAGFEQIGKLKAADPGVDLTQRDVSTCNNPTFIAGQPSRNYLAEIAPQPPECDQTGQGPCSDTVDTGLTNPLQSGGGPGGGGPGGGGPTAPGSTAPGSTRPGSTAPGSTRPGSTAPGSTRPGSTTPGSTAGGGPVGSSQQAGSGQAQTAAGPSTTDSATSARSVADGPPAIIPYRSAGATRLLAPLAVALLVIALIAVPILVLVFTLRPKEDT